MGEGGTQGQESTPHAVIMDGLVITAIGLVLAILGPFNTYQAPLVVRLAYWIGTMVAGQLVFAALIRGLHLLATRWALPDAMVWLGAAVVGSVPMTAIVALINRAAFGFMPRAAAQWLEFYFLVLVVSLTVIAIRWLISSRRAALRTVTGRLDIAVYPTLAAAGPPLPLPGHRLLDRLPLAKRGALLALESEDHYVRIHTSQGSALVLMRLRDAIAETDGIDGAQVHRSWWVARAAVVKTLRMDGAMTLRLGNDAIAPVAKSSVADLAAQGWFNDHLG
jgi:hypothetical protein